MEPSNADYFFEQSQALPLSSRRRASVSGAISVLSPVSPRDSRSLSPPARPRSVRPASVEILVHTDTSEGEAELDDDSAAAVVQTPPGVASTPIDPGQWAVADNVQVQQAHVHTTTSTASAAGGADDDYHALSEGRSTPSLPPRVSSVLSPPKLGTSKPATPALKSDTTPPQASASNSRPARVAAAAALAPETLLDADDEDGDPGGVAVCFPERWRDKERRIAQSSPYAAHPGWRLVPVIVKANDDLRQEQFTSQLLRAFARIFKARQIPAWLRPYDILATEARGGLIHAIPDTISLDSLKRTVPAYTTLEAWFVDHFRRGPHGDARLHAARVNFAQSMAGYSIACYVLNIKDRHNGNILLTRRGHIVHIDYGFLLTSSPGGAWRACGAAFYIGYTAAVSLVQEI